MTVPLEPSETLVTWGRPRASVLWKRNTNTHTHTRAGEEEQKKTDYYLTLRNAFICWYFESKQPKISYPGNQLTPLEFKGHSVHFNNTLVFRVTTHDSKVSPVRGWCWVVQTEAWEVEEVWTTDPWKRQQRLHVDQWTMIQYTPHIPEWVIPPFLHHLFYLSKQSQHCCPIQ